ncbi:alpha/beta hydrolase [Streptomyces netropsis]
MTHSPDGPQPPQGRRPRFRARRWIITVASLATLGLVAWPVLDHFDIPPFTDKGDPISFARGQSHGDPGKVNADTLMPTGPERTFTIDDTVDDGTKIARTTLRGEKSGFTGDVWVWAPDQYLHDKKYARSGFPVMIALPGGPGYPVNYWSETKRKLQSSIAKWSKEGKSLPFILVMPVLNPDEKRYYDGSDIPGQAKMGTWLTEDVPDLVKQNFRTLKSRDGWAFMGSSSGGFASLKSVLKYPDRFKAVIASGPDIVPDSPLWAGHEKEKQENNPQKLAQKLINRKGPDVYLAFQVGTKEPVKRLKDIQKFQARYGKGPVHTSLRVIEGGKHSARSYVPSLGKGPLQYISEHMQGPTPSP